MGSCREPLKVSCLLGKWKGREEPQGLVKVEPIGACSRSNVETKDERGVKDDSGLRTGGR